MYSIFARLLPHVRIITCRLILITERFDSVHVGYSTAGVWRTYNLEQSSKCIIVFGTLAQLIFHMYFYTVRKITNQHSTQMTFSQRLHWNLFGRRPLWLSLRLVYAPRSTFTHTSWTYLLLPLRFNSFFEIVIISFRQSKSFVFIFNDFSFYV